jgi:hypothetical protein
VAEAILEPVGNFGPLEGEHQMRIGDAHPLTEPANRPRTKNRWSDKNTTKGITIETKAAAVSR